MWGRRLAVNRDTDVVVIGGGVIGCAVGYYAAKLGARVTLVERDHIGGGTSAANPGSIAMATKRGGILLRLAVASQRLHAGLAAELGAETEYGVEGNLIVAENETELAYLEELHADQSAAGVEVELVSAQRCRALNPLLEGYLLGGLYCGTDAHANPFKVTQAFARAAQDRNIRLMTGTTVESIDAADGRVRAVVTSSGKISTDWIVNAAGPHAGAIGKLVGVEHPVVPRRGQIVVLEATPGLPAIRVSGASQLLAKHAKAPGAAPAVNVSLSYTRKALSGTVLLGSTNEFAGFDTTNTLEAVTGICECATRFMPRLGALNVLRSWAGLRPYSASGPLLGHVGGPENYLVASGHGGDGMALSPVTGRYIAEWLACDRAPPSIDGFLDRLRDTAAVSASPG